MNQPVSITSAALPALIFAANERAGMRFLEFFAANIHNRHTRHAYARATMVADDLGDRPPSYEASP
jgi:hypothetical protein